MENRQLLMIEDEEEICQQVADYFAADDGITLMDTVQDGCVSQEQLVKADVLVLDLIVPQQDGISVLEQVVQMPPQLRPEVIITSWFASKEIIQHTLSSGTPSKSVFSFTVSCVFPYSPRRAALLTFPPSI